MPTIRNARGSDLIVTDGDETVFFGVQWAAHRLIFTLLKCEIPEGLILCYACDTPACVNPSHHGLGIEKDNVRDMIGKKRAAWQT
jgi:hypothetical protein